MIAVTGASGQLGQLVIQELVKSVPAGSVVALVRNPAKAKDLASLGVQVRAADYDDPASLDKALASVEKLLLISSNEIGRRSAQHRNVLAAAKRRNVGFVAYTSLLHADTSVLDLAAEHLDTEAALRESGLSFTILRNGWYTENYAASVPPALAHGAFYGSAGEGRISSAARIDYAVAAVKVLLGAGTPGKVYELAGDHAYTLSEFAAEISKAAGKPIPYVNIPEAAYREALLKAGLPPVLAAGLASWDTGASTGALFHSGRELSLLIGRPTTPMADTVRAAVAAAR